MDRLPKQDTFDECLFFFLEAGGGGGGPRPRTKDSSVLGVYRGGPLFMETASCLKESGAR